MMRTVSLFVSLLLWGGLLAGLGTVMAEERIRSFHSEVVVRSDGWLEVKEQITVTVEGRLIQRGIFRDFPQSYVRRGGWREIRPFEVLAVSRNGQDEVYRVEKMSHGTRVWIGSPEVILPNGSEQVYEIRYQTDRQLILEASGDELYWNVTGNEWSFPIDEVRARVWLPAGAQAVSQEAWTGVSGETGQDHTLSYQEGREGEVAQAEFVTTRPLGIGEGLTVALRWQSGLLDPVAYEKRSLWQDNKAVLSGLVLLALSLWWYGVSWFRVGRDPRKGLIMPRWEPPQGFSPAAVRHLRLMGFDPVAFSAAVIGLASKGVIKIEEEGGKFTLFRTGKSPEGLEEDEALLYGRLMGDAQQVELDQANHQTIGGARDVLSSHLDQRMEGRYFSRNFGKWCVGFLLSLIGLAVMMIDWDQQDDLMVPFIATGILSMVVMGLLHAQVRRLLERRRKGFWSTSFWLLLVLPVWAFLVWLLWSEAGGIFTSAMVAAGAVGMLFHHWMKAPSVEGRRCLDEIVGFREYLSVAEEERLNLENPPEITPELFERFLPYALALEVEQKWAEKFERAMAKVGGASQEHDSSRYSPSYYQGSAANFGTIASGAALGAALTSALTSSAASPQSSSSSGGGGGSSGGGGGGGGGGGW